MATASAAVLASLAFATTDCWARQGRSKDGRSPSKLIDIQISSVDPADSDVAVGSTKVLTIVYQAVTRASQIRNAMIQIGDSAVQSIYVQFSRRDGGRFFLLNAGGAAKYDDDGCPPKSSTPQVNQRGQLICAQSAFRENGKALILTIVIQPKATFLGSHEIYLMATDETNTDTAVVKKGSLTVK